MYCIFSSLYCLKISDFSGNNNTMKKKKKNAVFFFFKQWEIEYGRDFFFFFFDLSPFFHLFPNYVNSYIF